MMQDIKNQMNQAAEQSHGAIAKTRVGIVDSYNPDTYSVKVKLQPDDTITGWLPILSAWVGNEWGMFCPPAIGDSVQVEFLDGDIDAGVTGLRFFNDEDRPLPCPDGEFWLVHKSGSMFKFLTNGDVQLVAAGNLAIQATNIAITSSTLKHNGKNIGDALRVTGVQTGVGTSGVPI